MSKKNKFLDRRQFLFAYFPGNTLFHKLNPLSKLIFLIYLTFFILATRSLILMSILTVIVLLLALFSGITLKNLMRKLRFMIIVMIVSVLLNIFFNAIPSDKDFVLFYLFGIKWLPIRRLAVYFAFKAFFLIIILYTSTLIYTNTTDMKDFVYALMRLKIPYKYCFAFMVGVRFLPMIEQEAKTISLAQKARGFSREKVNSITKAYNFIFERLTSTLITVLRKANTTSISMENRCFGISKERTNLIRVTFKRIDIVFIICVTGLFIFGMLYWLGLTMLFQFPSLYSLFKDFFP